MTDFTISEDALANLTTEIDKGRSDIVYFAEHFLGITLFQEQKVWLRNSTLPTNILIPGNRWGKSLCIAVKHIWHHFYQIVGPGVNKEDLGRYQTANLAPHSEVSKVVWEYIWRIIKGEFSFFDPQTRKTRRNVSRIKYFFKDKKELPHPEIEFNYGGKFIARSTSEDRGVSIQGLTFAYISYDEAARSHHLRYELEGNIKPRLTDLNGTLDIISTPDQSSPSFLEFYSLNQEAVADPQHFYVQGGSVFENSYLPPESRNRIDEETRGELRDQILHGKFVFSTSTLFNHNEIENIFDNTLSYEEPQAGHKYAMGIDLALGDDFTVLYVLDVTSHPYRIVRKLRFRGMEQSPQFQLELIRNQWKEYAITPLLPEWYDRKSLLMEEEEFIESKQRERFAPASNLLTALDASGMGGLYAQGFLSDIIDAPVSITAKNKPAILSCLKNALVDNIIKSPPDEDLKKELYLYREDDTSLQTDCVMALALITYKLSETEVPAPYLSRTMT